MEEIRAPGEAELIAEQKRQLEAMMSDLERATTRRERRRIRRRIRRLRRRSFNGEMLRW